MQHYFVKNRLSEQADEWGMHVLLLGGSLLLFIYLWGIRLPAFTAGIALYVFLITLRRTGREKRLRQKESRLRRQLGGELALERLLVQSPERTHFEAALLLSARHHFQLTRITEDGVLCQKGHQTLLIHYLQMHRDDTLTGERVAFFQRLCARHTAHAVWLCVPGKISPQAAQQSELQPPVRLIAREWLIPLFGSAAPATDSQLVMLSRRRKAPMHRRAWLEELLCTDNISRFARFAALMAALLFLTRQQIYGYSAVMMMVLCTLCRCAAVRKQKTLPGRSV